MAYRWLLIWSGFFGATGVGLGAFAAHGLKKVFSADALAVWETAVRYQFYHTLVLLILFVLLQVKPLQGITLAAKLMIAGILCFSGSLYLMMLTGIKILGPVTPLGGTFLIAGWLCLFYAGIKNRNSAPR